MTDTGVQPRQSAAQHRRRVRVSPQRIEAIIAAAQRRGLSASGITQHADGSTTIHFGEAGSLLAQGKTLPGTGWEDV
jgi:hypothetical protein